LYRLALKLQLLNARETKKPIKQTSITANQHHNINRTKIQTAKQRGLRATQAERPPGSANTSQVGAKHAG
jgi:hypothetical protein